MRYIYWFYILILFPFSGVSQNVGRLEKQAGYLFEKKDFKNALTIYELINEKKQGDVNVLTHMGVCYFELNNLKKTEEVLYAAAFENKELPSIYYLYAGKLFHAKLEFENAIKNYKDFLREIKNNDKRRASVKDAILRCSNGMMVRRQPPIGEVLHFDNILNSSADELRPLPSPSQMGVVYFSSDRPPGNSHDIYSIKREESGWSVPVSLGLTLNSKKQELPLGFNETGEQLYFFRSDDLNAGQILVDTFKEDLSKKNMLHDEFISPINPAMGDCDLHFYDDETILFASRRKGGFGGLDIYVTTRTQEGWTMPKNLGSTINSAYDDRWPFLAADGRTLYFSTNDARRSIGKMDILKSIYLEQPEKWTPPENMGIPFNSAEDEECFFISENGGYALFTSGRKTGFGKRDIYMGIFSDKINMQSERGIPFVGQPRKNENKEESSRPKNNVKGFTIYPLKYIDNNLPLPEEALVELRKISVLLKNYPQLKIILCGYSSNEGERVDAMTPILNQAILFLKNENINLRQIKWLAAPNKYLPQKNGPRALDVFLANPELLPPFIEIKKTPGESFPSNFFKKAMSGLVYQVQVPLGESVHLEELLEFYPESMLSQQIADEQMFVAPDFHLSWSAALEAEKAIRQIGFFDTRIVPLLNGWELDKDTAGRYLHEFPELKNFID